MDNLSNQTLRGYEIREQIGIGGFGTVYRAYQPLLKREVAIKVILPQYANQPDFIRRFEVEAELVARLEHPHIVPLFDYWREPDSAYLVMRLLRGGTLKEIIAQEPLSTQQTIHILDQIADALHIAHRNHVVHRDMKPANILLDEDNNAYLTDFGIAKSTDYDSRSATGSITGSLPYAAPEQIRSEKLTPRTDIYAVGIIVYEMLTRQHPFGAEEVPALIYKHLTEPLPNICDIRTDVPIAVDSVIQRATAKSASDRYADVRDLAKALRGAFAGAAPIVDSAPTLDTGTSVDLPNPYQGLRAFQEADADRFFGRAELVQRLLQRLAQPEIEERFLAVVGPSGSGKSSVVKAGLLPALRQGLLPNSEKWFITEMFPGTHPFEELEAALLRIAVNPPTSLLDQLREDERGFVRAIKRILPADDSELLLVIDQFEELFTLVDDEAIRTLFLNNLLAVMNAARSRMRIIVTLRADFYDRPLQYRDFGELLRKRTEIILPMSEAELQQAILQPAAQVQARLQTGLMEAVLKDVREQPGTLPLLQYALTELFERRSGRILTLGAYQAIGGVTGALARRAEELYTQMDEEGQAALRQLFLRLVTLGEGTEDTRRRVRRSELPDHPQFDAVLGRYGQYRLLTFDRDPVTRGPTIEIAHEALIRTWQRLREWVNQRRDDLRLHRRLTVATTEWLEGDEDPGLLARDTRLEQFEAWANSTDIALNADEQRFLSESLAARHERNRLEALRKARELQIANRVQNFQRASMILAMMVVLAVVAIIGAILTANDARKQRDTAFTVGTQAAGVATFFALQQGRIGTLAAGNVVISGNDLVQTPEAFLATEMAIATLSQWQPQVQSFDGVEMVLVPAGCFWMGSMVNASEQPVNEVCFDAPFWIDRYEVSNGQFEQFGGQAAYPPRWDEANMPRTAVTWYEVYDFCALRGARLPTEAEWEYAARGPDSLVYPWGNEYVAENLLYSIARPVPVDYQGGDVSWVGAHHLSGNISEWTNTTIYKIGFGAERAEFPYPYATDDGREDYYAPSAHILRGGAWLNSDDVESIRAAFRIDSVPDIPNIFWGFRCARYAE